MHNLIRRPHFAVSDQIMQCLSLSHKMDSRLKWVNPTISMLTLGPMGAVNDFFPVGNWSTMLNPDLSYFENSSDFFQLAS